MADLHALGARELLHGYRRREFSPVDAMHSVLGQIERWEPHLRATYLLRPEIALAIMALRVSPVSGSTNAEPFQPNLKLRDWAETQT